MDGPSRRARLRRHCSLGWPAELTRSSNSPFGRRPKTSTAQDAPPRGSDPPSISPIRRNSLIEMVTLWHRSLMVPGPVADLGARSMVDDIAPPRKASGYGTACLVQTSAVGRSSAAQDDRGVLDGWTWPSPRCRSWRRRRGPGGGTPSDGARAPLARAAGLPAPGCAAPGCAAAGTTRPVNGSACRSRSCRRPRSRRQ